MTARNLALTALLAASVIGGAWAARNVQVLRVTSAFEVTERFMRSHVSGLMAWRTSATAVAAAAQAEPIRVNGSHPLLPPGLTLSGEVTGVPAALQNSITVIAYAGGKAYPAAVDGAAYRVPIGRLADGEMVRIEAFSQRIHYVSAIGSYGKLRQMAGDDSYLDISDHYRLRVSPYSSALAWMIRIALGRDAVSDAEFATATRSIHYSDMVSVANTLFLVAYEFFMPLPSGFSDGWQLLGDEAAYRATVEAYVSAYQATETFESDAISGFLDQPDYAKFASLSEMPETTLLLGAVPAGDVAVDVSIYSTGRPVSDARLLVKNSDGTITGYSAQGNGAVRFDARVSHDYETDGEIILMPIGATFEQVWSYTWFSPTTLQRTSRQLQSTRLRRFFVGDGSSIWASTSSWKVRYPDSPSRPSETIYERRIASAIDLDRQYLHNAWVGLSGRRGLPWICESAAQLEVCEYAQYRFDGAGAGLVEDLGMKLVSGFMPGSNDGQDAFSWSVDAGGRLQARVRDADITFWTLPGGNTAADSIVYLARGRTPATAEKALFGQTLSLRVEAPAFAEAEAAGTWKPGGTTTVPVRYPNPLADLTIRRNPDFTSQENYSEFGQNVDSFVGGWQWSMQRTYDYQVSASFPSGTQWVTNCSSAYAAGATRCAPRRGRYFKPLKRVGNRMYGIEELYTYSGPLLLSSEYGSLVPERKISRPNFYSCVDGACQASTTMALLAVRKPAAMASNVGGPGNSLQGRYRRAR